LVPNYYTDGGYVVGGFADPKCGIHNSGGRSIMVHESCCGEVDRNTKYSGWTVMSRAESAYATTDSVSPVPAGGAVEFAIDYTARTCRVAFYTPAAVAGGFAEAPHAKMELRFVATPQGKDHWGYLLPEHCEPAAPNSRMLLYPAVATTRFGNANGSIWRFVAV
jgi:hypothetical protein